MSVGEKVRVVINSEIKSIEEAENSDRETYSLDTEAIMYNKNEALYLLYEESEISGLEGSKSRIKIEKDKISMKRYGSNSVDFVFEEGKSNYSLYKTRYGNFDMYCDTKKLEIQHNPIHISIDYMLVIQNLSESHNKIEISVIE